MNVVVKLLGLFGAAVLFKHFDRHPLHPWEKVGSSAYVLVRNTSDSAQMVCAMAPEVDHAVRTVGVLPPHDAAFLRMPYADTRVTLLLSNACPTRLEGTHDVTAP